MKRTFSYAVFLSASLLLAQDATHAPKNPEAGKPEAIAAGQRRFREGCAGCHGANGAGGRGPSLIENPELQGFSDDQLFKTIRNGIRGTGMPPSPMSDTLTWQVAAFVRNLSAPAIGMPVTGNVDAGRAAYERARCSECHMIHGEGGYLGPDLTNIGGTRTLGDIQLAIADPDKRRTPGFTGVTAKLNDGSTITGIAKNNSNYTVQILDAKGQLHLLNRADIAHLEFAPKSLMPDDYAHTLAPGDLDNIVAFLSRQAVRPEAALREGRDARAEH